MGEDTLNTQNRFVLRASHYTKLQKDVTFQNAIYTVPKENVIESLFKIIFEILQVFIDGSVIITKVNNNYETYFVSKKKDDFMEVYPLEYDYKIGLSVSSFEPIELSYRLLLIDKYYLKEHEEKIIQTIESKSLRLISGRKVYR